MAQYMRVEDLKVYNRLCELHIEVCEIARKWPPEERYELGSQIRRSSNSSPAQLAERNNDRHIRNRIDGVNRARNEALETVHHLYIARLKRYIDGTAYEALQERYQECVRMLNGLEQSMEQQLPASDRRWPSSSIDSSLNPEL